MKPIWYFVGLFLLFTGAIVTGAGVYDYFNPPAQKTVLANLHPGIWWGCIILAAGFIFFVTNRKKTVE